jgi:UDP-N-acetylmuramoylalanine--D-glutamate ligase
MMNGAGKTVLVLGLGESGLAMAQWLRAPGRPRARGRFAQRAAVCRRAEAQRARRGLLLTGSFNEELLDGAELLGLSPGLSLNEPVVAEAARRGIPSSARSSCSPAPARTRRARNAR